MRPIGIPTIKDRVVQGVIRCALEPEWESKFECSSYGYRPGRQINDVVSRINRILMQPSKAWVLEGDISQFFDCIDHSFLLNRLEHFTGYDLIEKWLKAGIFLDLVFYETDEGTPPDIRGSYFSPSCEHLFAWLTRGVRHQGAA
jgi:RNA-directed DNA polymerase